MLCPFCLEDVTFQKERIRQQLIYSCPTPDCPSQDDLVPPLYLDYYRKKPPVVVSTIGFRGHGKTVYLASLFFTFQGDQLPRIWRRSGFGTMCLNKDSLKTVSDGVDALKQGKLPPPNPQTFPKPTMVHINGVPMQRDYTLLFYDAAGESFEDAEKLVKYAGFVRRARTVLFLYRL